MKKRCYFIAVMLLGFFSSASFASIQSFWSYGSSDSASNSKHVGGKTGSTNISIDYKIESNWSVKSATLWIKAVDDFKGGSCSGRNCKDGNYAGRDSKERANISNIEGKGNRSSVEIGGEKWYNLLDVTSFLSKDTNKMFSAVLKTSKGSDFWFKNAKLVIDYDINDNTTPPAAVPLPSAVWLFGSVLLGLAGFKRKPGMTA
jgi:hypothetical protein